MSHHPVRRVVVVGNGFEAWLTAASIAHSLGPGLLSLTLCPVAGSAAWDPFYTLWPARPQDPLAKLGFSDLELVHSFDAGFALGARFGPGRWLPFSPVGLALAGVPFHQHWCLARADTGVADYFRFSPGTRAMMNNTFAPPVPRNAIGPLQHEFARQLDIAALTEALRAQTRMFATFVQAAELGEVVWGDQSHLLALIDGQGQRLEADLFVDASGPCRALAHADDRWQRHPLLPAFDCQVESNPARGEPQAWYDVEPTEAGWQVKSRSRSKEHALNLRHAGEKGALQTGYLTQPWRGNRLALGHAAVHTLPLLPLHVALFQACIGRAIDLMPGADQGAHESLEYNQLFGVDALECLDLLALHEMGRNQDGGVASVQPDSDLGNKVALFAKRGWVAPGDGQVISEVDWVNNLLFCGVMPTVATPMTHRLNNTERSAQLAELDRRITQVVSEFPRLPDYLDAALALRQDKASGG